MRNKGKQALRVWCIPAGVPVATHIEGKKSDEVSLARQTLLTRAGKQVELLAAAMFQKHTVFSMVMQRVHE